MSYRRRDKHDDSPQEDSGASKDDFSHSKDDNRHSPYFVAKRHHTSVATHLGSIHYQALALVFVAWLAALHYFERIEVASVINKCQWTNWELWPLGTEPHRVAFLADPQIVDEYSYEGRPALLNYIIRRIADNYLHRNHRYIQQVLDPHTTIFLGDLFDGGREWDDDVWLNEYRRFNAVFPKQANRRTINIVAGNHDIGFEKIDHHVLHRFAQYFGDLNDYVELGNHTLVFLDTISLSHPDPVVNAAPKQFLDTINDKINTKFPRILLLHVPLYRFNDKSPCGPLREKQTPFPIQKGKQYQTVIEYDISQKVLATINPVVLFAGDDHDYCDIHQFYTFEDELRIAREIAAKSCAMTSGIKYPAIQLLSLNNPVDGHLNPIDSVGKPAGSSYPRNDLRSSDSTFTYNTELCYMPNPYKSLRVYGLIFESSAG
ncbi:Metallo-dependent phosphatase [Suhomyces tanzawaensis NRRL Y-17324]|uniref:Metallo-dependent phosphatase n=1 Tax=Suhomyces tanzawaensis NRRL Y-17324 TaxID=984487 RepID=A0A1E4SB49_9ASCO|nr:Metallo-dependent phosphatase [Suhomyces tanzawaensis NRRL Y-17324]ODV76696.1 Metallo-dependent phosphatase [Suhomyces tanzawaensis NRRL Y-17324]